MPDQRPRLSTRDLIGPVLVFFGALLVAVAFAIGPLVADGLRKVPLSVDQTWVSDGADGARALDRCSLQAPQARVVEARIQQQRRVVAVRPADADVVTLQAGTALGIDEYLIDGRPVDTEDACDETTITAMVDRVTLNRRTASPTGNSEVQYDDERAATVIDDRRGYTYLLPFGFDADRAEYFDPVTRQALPMTPTGSETMGGRDVTRFSVTVPLTDLGAAEQDPRAVITKPARWFGRFPGVGPTDELTATLQHRAQRELFVDTATGVLVAERAEISEVFRFTPDLRERNRALADFALTNLEVTLSPDRQTVRESSEYASSRAWPVTVTTRVVPVVAGVLGAVLLVIGGWVLVRSGRRTQPPDADSSGSGADEDAPDPERPRGAPPATPTGPRTD
ncbi:DUF3068 domain-containing protein [Gordonia iterans]|uniref:DUF3068 domain-containing protein n=1 Tax=Gordonia iterans TaxID=1004901 RepID=A0A2S0KBC6_9ACTN|nr:DUF3068 domain-containing protein [Gordonia iterans]AVL98977.1 DUF3068 domain-containing protein [Gordonia iterans]